MMKSNRGAARISAVWLIVLLVLFFASVAFAFMAYNDAAAALDREQLALGARDEALVNMEEFQTEVRAISETLGFYDREAASAKTNLGTAKDSLDLLKTSVPGLDNVTDFESAVEPAIQAYRAAASEAQTLRAQRAQLQSDLSAANASKSDQADAKDAELRALRQELQDLQDTSQSRISDLEGRVAAANARTSELDNQMRQVRAETQSTVNEKDRMIAALEVQVRRQASKLDFTRKDKSSRPDGAFLSVSKPLGVGWIDIGANQRLVPGIAFDVLSGNPLDRRFKARAVVESVEANRAVVRVTDVADPFNPVTPDDVVVNPLFDPSGERVAVLAGRFSGKYNAKELTGLLARIGVTVIPASQISRNVDYLIVGAPMWNDPETGEPLEQALQPSELPVYQQGESMGLTILPLKNIDQYFVQ